MAQTELLLGDCIERLKDIPDNSIDSIVTDPPYGLSKPPDIVEVMSNWIEGNDYEHTGGGFMGKSWDSFVPGPSVWRECYRVLKPGGYILAFAGTRTQDLMSISLRMAGFELKDTVMWVFGSGFPKSSDISKQIDKAAGYHRGKAGKAIQDNSRLKSPNYERTDKGSPITDEAKRWEGWGTQLKPAYEPILMFRKPHKGTIYKNVVENGVGAMNIDASRVGSEGGCERPIEAGKDTTKTVTAYGNGLNGVSSKPVEGLGRWPANVILGHNEDCELVGEEKKETVEQWNCTEGCAVRLLDEQSGISKSPSTYVRDPNSRQNVGHTPGSEGGNQTVSLNYGDEGGASRFFYQAKANKKEKNFGLTKEVENDRFQTRLCTQCKKNVPYVGSCGCENAEIEMVAPKPTKNAHPTVKPIDLMRYLVKLVTPLNGTTLDPFLGSGTSGIAAHLEGFNFIGIEKDEEYFELANERINYWKQFEGETKEILKTNG